MSFKDQLSAVLRGEAAVDLTPEAREALEGLAHEAHAAGQEVLLRDECAARLRQPGASGAVDYLLAAACALHGEVERAHQTLLALGEKLAAAKRWEPLAAVAERALGLEETQAAARLLVRAHEGLNTEPGLRAALERAWRIIPEDLELGLKLAVRLGETGEGGRRRELLASLLPRFAEQSNFSGLEEAALEFVEHQAVEGLVALLEILPVVAKQGALRECEQLLGLAFPEVARAGVAGRCHAALRAMAQRAAEARGPGAAEPFRDALIESLRQGAARELPDLQRVLASSALTDRAQPLLQALERFDAIAALPPGRAVLHDSFGAGRVTADDGENVLIDFVHARGHRMPYAAARRTLTPLPEDDLRLLGVQHPEELKQLREHDPGEMIARALRPLGGDADAQKLKVFLVGSNLVPAAEWNTFWRRARAAAAKHPAIDASRAFEQRYRLAPEGPGPASAADVERGHARSARGAGHPDPARAPREAGSGAAHRGATERGPGARQRSGPVPAVEEGPLPALEPRRPVRANLTTLRKFLSQHPQAEAALARRFGRYVLRVMADPEGERADRARAGLYAARWYPGRQPEWIAVLKSLWDQGLSISDLTGEDEQIALLECSHAAGVEADAILSALDSRFSAVQARADRYRDALDERGRAVLRRTMVLHAARYPAASLRLIEESLEAAGAPPVDAWLLFSAALALIEERPLPSTAEKVLRWLEPGGAFDRLLAGSECPEEPRLKVRVLLRQWHSSDRMLFPALDSLERLGLGAEAEAFRAQRRQRTERLFDRVGEAGTPGEAGAEADVAVMTRATWERLRQELERLEKELRTTIPSAIQKARELGDLRENAEYHSAKLKQANVSKLVASLQLRLARARFVDDMAHRDGVVGLGAEVVLESDDEVVTYWILGAGEHHHGEHVISFQAPVGRALMGRAIGDDVELGEGPQRRRYRIVSIERRLPASAAPAGSPPAKPGPGSAAPDSPP